jgi:hypothetical protein
MKSQQLLYLLATLLLATGCAHTNKLAEYPIAGKTAVYRTSVSADASGSWLEVDSPSDNTAANVVAAIGSVILTDQARKKLDRAVSRDSIAHYLSGGVRSATYDYLALREVASTADNPDLIIETQVTDFKVVSSSLGLHIRASGKTRIIVRATGMIVWENDESHTVPLSATYLAPLGGRVVRSGASIFNAVQFFNLSEEEIREVVNRAAEDAGSEIGETLREDVADLHGK